MPKQSGIRRRDRGQTDRSGFDEDSARKKVEKAFDSGPPLGVDVDAGAGVWTYAVVPPEDASG